MNADNKNNEIDFNSLRKFLYSIKDFDIFYQFYMMINWVAKYVDFSDIDEEMNTLITKANLRARDKLIDSYASETRDPENDGAHVNGRNDWNEHYAGKHYNGNS